MSECYSAQGLPDKAVETARRAVSVGGEKMDTLALLGAALHDSDLFDEALSVFRKVLVLMTLERGPRTRLVADAYYRIGRCLRSLGKYDEALESFYSAHDLWRNCG